MNNDWESWIRYFLASIKNQALDTQNKVKSMLELYKFIKQRLTGFNSQYAINLLDIIFENPIVSFQSIKKRMNTNSYQTIYNVLQKFVTENILFEITGAKRNKVYVFEELMKIVR